MTRSSTSKTIRLIVRIGFVTAVLLFLFALLNVLYWARYNQRIQWMTGRYFNMVPDPRIPDSNAGRISFSFPGISSTPYLSLCTAGNLHNANRLDVLGWSTWNNEYMVASQDGRTRSQPLPPPQFMINAYRIYGGAKVLPRPGVDEVLTFDNQRGVLMFRNLAENRTVRETLIPELVSAPVESIHVGIGANGPDVIVLNAHSTNNLVALVNPDDGTLLKVIPVITESNVSTMQLDDDPEAEILIVSPGGHYEVLNHDGTMLAEGRLQQTPGSIRLILPIKFPDGRRGFRIDEGNNKYTAFYDLEGKQIELTLEGQAFLPANEMDYVIYVPPAERIDLGDGRSVVTDRGYLMVVDEAGRRVDAMASTKIHFDVIGRDAETGEVYVILKTDTTSILGILKLE